MATTQEAIARLRMIFETQGAAAAVAEMKKLETAETSLGASSLNLDRAFGNLERRFSETARATFEYERSMKTLNAAVAQNPALAERAAAVQQTIAARYQATMQAAHQAAQAQTAVGQVSQAAQAQVQGLAASTGLLGSTLLTLGTAGTVAAVGIGGLYLAYQKLDAGVTKTAQYARETVQFAEATGLTTSQIQGLNKEAARFGISTQELHAGLLRFTAGFEEVRNGGGAMLDIIRKIDPALAEQAVSAGNETEALNIVGEALRRATNEFDRARLARAAFGRGGSDIALMVKGLDLGAVTEKYSTKGISEDLLREIRKLEAEVETKGANVENRLYGSFAAPWLKAKLAVIEYLEAFLKVQEAANQQTMATHVQELINLQKELQGGIEQLEKAATSDNFLDRLFSEANQANADAYKEKLKEVTAELDKLQGKMTDQARLEDAFKQTDAMTKTAPPPRGQVQFQMGAVAPGTDERQLAAIQAIKAEYPGLVAQDAIRMSQLEGQLRIAEAMPGVARMQAEEQVRINQLLLEGKELTLATTIAAKERAVAQAQINSAAANQLAAMHDQLRVAQAMPGVQRMQAQQQATYNQLVRQGVAPELAMTMAKKQTAIAQAEINAQAQLQLFNLRNQAGVAAAVTGAEKIRAQEIATINALLQQGVDLELASQIAAQERANAEAAVKAQIEQQIISLNESTELIYAQLRGNELNVKVRQAYNRAIREGADDETAAALAAATYNNLIAQRALQISQMQQAPEPDAQDRATTTRPAVGGGGAGVQEIQAAANAGSTIARNWLSMALGEGRGAAMLVSPDLSVVWQAIQAELRGLPLAQQQRQAQQQAQQQLLSLQNQARLGAAGTPQEKAQIQAEITYEDLIRQGVQSDLAHQIANQELANAMQDLAKSVDANTSALQDQLDPIYTEGRAALRIGYYGEGSGGTMRTVTGTGYANDNAGRAAGGDVYGGIGYMIGERGPELFIPGASGTIVPNAALRGAGAAQTGNVIIINNNFPAGAVMGDRRTQYQMANSYGRAVAAMGS